MKISISIDDDVGECFLQAAGKRGQSLSHFLVDAGRAAMRLDQVRPESNFELVTFKGSGVVDGVDLDRTSDLLI